MSFLDHLEALRWHLVRSVIAIMVGGALAFVNKSILFDQIIFYPKAVDFPTYVFFCEWGSRIGQDYFCFTEMPFTLLNTRMAGQFSTHIWVSIIAGLILAFPYVVWEIWRFLKPGLRPNERKYSRFSIFAISFLFGLGVLFGYFLVVPLSIQFLGTYSVSNEVTNFIDLSSFISTVTTVTLACALLFQLPVFAYFLTVIGLVTPEFLKTYRKHAIVLILILSAIITPPDVSSQILVSIPVFFLYQFSISVSRWAIKNKERETTK